MVTSRSLSLAGQKGLPRKGNPRTFSLLTASASGIARKGSRIYFASIFFRRSFLPPRIYQPGPILHYYVVSHFPPSASAPILFFPLKAKRTLNGATHDCKRTRNPSEGDNYQFPTRRPASVRESSSSRPSLSRRESSTTHRCDPSRTKPQPPSPPPNPRAVFFIPDVTRRRKLGQPRNIRT